MSTLSEVQQALINSQVTQQHWIDGGWEALSNQLEEELRKENEIVKLFPLVDQTEPDIRVYVKIFQRHFIYCVPLSDVTDVVDINQVLYIQKEDLYLNWKERIISKLGNSYKVKQIIDDKKITWNKTEYIDKLG